MASTNKTTNYNLSQFIGADKPAWLQDYNGDMLKIDTGIAAAASTATGADGKADANATAIGTLSNLTTTDKTSAVAAINEVNTAAGAAQGTANTADGKANANALAITAIQTALAKFNLTDFRTPTVTATNFTISGTPDLASATNSDGSIGKIYGMVKGTPTAGGATIHIADCGFRPTSKITVNGIVLYQDTSNVKEVNMASIDINTDGTIDLTNALGSYWNGKNIYFFFMASLIFMKDFGDTPIPQN